MKLLADWKDFPELKSLAKNKKFVADVVGRIDSTGSDADVEKIIAHSRKCAAADPLCRKIRNAAESALAAMKSE